MWLAERENLALENFREVLLVHAGDDASAEFQRTAVLAVVQTEGALDFQPAGQVMAADQLLQRRQQNIAAPLVAGGTHAEKERLRLAHR